MERFLLQKGSHPHTWVATDTVNHIVIVFDEHDYNNSQKITMLAGDLVSDTMSVPRALQEIGDWLYQNHKDILL
ncbi:MAG: hypothetical protein LKE54_07310 [Prevotella sp.]|jgi:hypothetical protein|nr:hypothetical protein [Prevotella sp.]MCH3994841.1 hypothetical protein [Prevotella sp.]